MWILRFFGFQAMAGQESHEPGAQTAGTWVSDRELTLLCSWCGRVMHQGRSQGQTHGICTECLAHDVFDEPEEPGVKTPHV